MRGLLHSIIGLAVAGPGAAQTCLWSTGFEADALPPGWTGSTTTIVATGETTAAWTVGTAEEADVNAYFPLPDDPVGNRAALANDDAPPCDCAMGDVMLTSPEIDLTPVMHAGLRCRVYHDGRPFNTHAWVEASADGLSWDVLREVPAVLGAWQALLLDLDAYAGGTVRLRFRYADGGAWASGMAVDDVCVFSRPASDVAIIEAVTGDATISPFLAGVRSLPYTHLPLEQASELVTTVRIRNLGHAPATGLNLTLEVTGNGNSLFTMSSNGSGPLAPLADTLWVLHTGWTPTATGPLDLSWAVTTGPPDENPGDNAGAAGLMITGPGVVNSHMALDNGIPETFIDNDGAGFSTGCRFELLGDTALVHGLAVKVGGDSQPGARLTALLTDGELNVLSAATTDTLSEGDLALCFAGGWLYLPFNEPVAVPADGDVLGLVRYDAGFGDLQFAAGGRVAQGSAVRVGSDGLSVSFPLRAPLVRLVLQDPVTAIGTTQVATLPVLAMHPNPAQDLVRLDIPEPAGAGVRVLDATGRIRMAGRYAQGMATMDVGDLPPGLYTVQVTGGTGLRSGRLVVVR